MTATDVRTVVTAQAAEQALLGGMLLNGDVRSTGISTVKAEDFESPRHGHIFAAITGLMASDSAVDIVTVETSLAGSGLLEAAGGRPYLFELQESVPSLRAAPSYAAIVLKAARTRRMSAAFSEGKELLAQGADPEDVIGAALGVLEDRPSNQVVSMGRLVDATLEILTEGQPQGRVGTGIPELDSLLLGGPLASQLVVVGARPSMGKTGFALGWTLEAARAGHQTLFVTAEMSVEELGMRLFARETGVPASILMTSEGVDSFSAGEWVKLNRATERLTELPISCIEGYPTVAEIRARVQAKAMTAEPFRFVVVDYLQLLTPTSSRDRGGSREQEVAEMSRSLKRLAMELDVTVVALSQLSRGLESRADKRPMLSDLRESGAVEQDANTVIFLYRPEVYTPGEDPGLIELHVAKQRNGPTGVARAMWLGERTAVLPLDAHHAGSGDSGPNGSP